MARAGQPPRHTCRGQRGRLSIFCQELKLKGVGRLEAETWCSRNGCQAFIGDCRQSDLGNSIAGVGVFVRSYINATRLDGPSDSGDGSCSIVPGWAVAVHVDFAMKGGLICSSCYLEQGSGIGPDSTNWQTLLRMGEFLRFFNRPFLIGGDFNVSGDVLQASGWIASIFGQVQASAFGTCRSASGIWSCIDYFVISRDLGQAVLGVQVVEGEPPIPHVPSQLRLSRTPRQYKELIMKKVK